MKPQLLAPVGSWDTLIAAVSNGADAVYLGTKLFNARRLADNFRPEELKKAVQYAHLHRVKVYITLNTLIKNNEIGPFLNQISSIEQAGADAVILQDLTFAPLIKEQFPNLEIHASTQATIMNTAAVEFWQKYVAVFVLARELTKQQIRRMYDATHAKLEVFVHGHLCSSYSGQCLISSLIGKRSGNRGLCASACRKPYNGDKYLISAKDLCLIENVNDVIESGAMTLKIEGRMKPAEYVGATTKYYRQQIDHAQTVSPQTITNLKMAFNREFTSGYFNNQKTIIDPLIPSNRGILLGTVRQGKLFLEADLHCYDGIGIVYQGKRTGEYVHEIFKDAEQVTAAKKGDMITLTMPAFRNGAKVFLTSKHQGQDLRGKKELLPVQISLVIKQEQKPEVLLSVQDKIHRFQLQALAQPPQKHPLTSEQLKIELQKFQSNIFSLSNIAIQTDNSFVPKSILTQLRNDLDQIILDLCVPIQKEKKALPLPQFPSQAAVEKKLHVRVYSLSGVEEAAVHGADVIYYDVFAADAAKAISIAHAFQTKLFLHTPMVMTDSDMKLCVKNIKQLQPDGLLINNVGLLNFDFNCAKVLGYQMNIFNDNQLQFYGLPAIASLELTAQELTAFKNKKDLIYFAHGYPVVMTFREDLATNSLHDQKGYTFKVRRTATQATEMLYSRSLGLLQHTPKLLDAGITQLFLDVEQDVGALTHAYKELLAGKRVDVAKFKHNVTVGNLEKGVM